MSDTGTPVPRGRPPIGERAMTPTERQRRRRERMRQVYADAEARHRADLEAGRQRRLLKWEQEHLSGDVNDDTRVALIDFRDATPQQIAEVIVRKAWGDKARQIADALAERLPEHEAAWVSVTNSDSSL